MKKGSTCSARTPLRIRNDLGTQLFPLVGVNFDKNNFLFLLYNIFVTFCYALKGLKKQSR